MQSESELRKRSCILHGITETENENTLALVHDFARKSCSVDPSRITKSFRLGKKREKSSAIKVVLVSEDDKWELIRRINGNSENKTQRVFGNLDLTETERNAEYQCRLKARALKESEPSDSKNSYKIRKVFISYYYEYNLTIIFLSN